ncbi:MAG: aminodeoxychorismate synthase component I [Paracoccaceae bacterium]
MTLIERQGFGAGGPALRRGLVELDCGPDGRPARFSEPRALIRADSASELAAAFAAIEAARAAGHWLAGYASYDLGLALEPKLKPRLAAPRENAPLLCFGVFDRPGPLTRETPAETAQLSRPEPLWGLARYRRAFDAVRAYIAAGDTYQVNLTFPMAALWQGDPRALFAALAARQPVGHGAYVDLGGPILLSRSPELFFHLDADGTITARPMKGTAPRSPDPVEDGARARWLQNDIKNRAENLMIVDLLRNDLSRLSQPGSVRVPVLFAVETYATVHQMVSTVTARLVGRPTVEAIFRALFPCGSITGAPKIRAMEIIDDLEASPRGSYCGAIGWIAPDGSMDFNVAIRTLVLQPDGVAQLNVGGGVVYDSDAGGEYDEALLKGRFAWLD